MSKSDAVNAVKRLMAAFRKDVISEDTAAIYLERLVDIPAELLKATIDRLIDTETFFPSIGEIRRTAAELAGLLPPSPAEALAIIRRADRTEIRGAERGGRGYVEKFWEWPEDLGGAALGLIQDVLAKVGEPSDLNGKPHFSWEMGFQKTYEKEAEVVRRDALADLSRARLHEGRNAVGAGNGKAERALGDAGSN